MVIYFLSYYHHDGIVVVVVAQLLYFFKYYSKCADFLFFLYCFVEVEFSFHNILFQEKLKVVHHFVQKSQHLPFLSLSNTLLFYKIVT